MRASIFSAVSYAHCQLIVIARVYLDRTIVSEWNTCIISCMYCTCMLLYSYKDALFYSTTRSILCLIFVYVVVIPVYSVNILSELVGKGSKLVVCNINCALYFKHQRKIYSHALGHIIAIYPCGVL